MDKWVHMVWHWLISRQDGATWLRIIKTPFDGKNKATFWQKVIPQIPENDPTVWGLRWDHMLKTNIQCWTVPSVPNANHKGNSCKLKLPRWPQHGTDTWRVTCMTRHATYWHETYWLGMTRNVWNMTQTSMPRSGTKILISPKPRTFSWKYIF